MPPAHLAPPSGVRSRFLRIALTADPELPVPPRHYGGIERIVDMLARGLSERGHSVTLFAHPESACPVPRVPWPGRSSRAALDTARNMATLARHVAAGGVDIVHSFARIAYFGPLLPFPIPKLMSYQRAISFRTTGLAHRLARGTLEFTAISRSMIEGTGLPGRWHLVPNGVSPAAYPFRAAVPADAPLVFLGRVEAIKGPHLAIAAARLAGRRLVVAGNVPDEHRPWFEATIAPHIDGDRVRYQGPVDDAQKGALLADAAALLMPVAWDEPFGIVMAEAMACGTPVIGLNRGAVPEVIADGITGFVVETVAEMAAAVARLPAIARAACRARVERLYSDTAIVEGYLQLYAELTGRVRGAAGDLRVRNEAPG
jgi:glycosyltransferase involved in cell wall biosynthesis